VLISKRFRRLGAVFGASAAVAVAVWWAAEHGLGAGDSAGPALREPAIPATRGPAPDDGTVLPLAAYRPTAPQLARLRRAEQLVAQQCMRRLGFAWEPPADAAGDRPLRTSPIGVTDPAQAGTFGYHDPGSAARVLLTEAPGPGARAEQAALSGSSASGQPPPPGTPAGGCLGEADRRLRGGEPAYDTGLLGRLTAEATEATERDRRIVAALTMWSACMARAGQHYAAPWDAQSQLWADKPTPSEIALATQDVACKDETQLSWIWPTVQAGYEQQLVERHRPALDAVRRVLSYRLDRSDEILREAA